MPEYTDNAALPRPTLGERDWHLPLQAALDQIDGAAGVGPLCVSRQETPSTTLYVRVAAGRFVRPGGTAIDVAEATLPVTDEATTCVWVDSAGSVQSGAAFPAASEHLPLAEVDADATHVTAIRDARLAFGATWQRPAGSDQSALDPGAIAALTFSDPPEPEEVESLRDALVATATLANALRSALVAMGAIKGGA